MTLALRPPSPAPYPKTHPRPQAYADKKKMADIINLINCILCLSLTLRLFFGIVKSNQHKGYKLVDDSC